MIIKSYTASTIAAALKKIREDLGGDAIVLKTRVCSPDEIRSTGKRIEITACIDEGAVDLEKLNMIQLSDQAHSEVDNKFVADASPGRGFIVENEPIIETVDRSEQYKHNLHRIYRNLIDNDIPETFAQGFCEELRQCTYDGEDFQQLAINKLVPRLEPLLAPGIKIRPGMKIAFVGPRGGGKSSVLAKTAAQLTTRLGLSTRLVSLELKNESEDASSLSVNDDNKSVLLIDTPPIDRDQDLQMKMLKRLDKIQVDQLFFVFSVCSRTSDLIGGADLFELFAPTFIIATHLDETNRWGGILSMTNYMDSQLAFITDSPADSGELIAPNAHTLAAALLTTEMSR